MKYMDRSFHFKTREEEVARIMKIVHNNPDLYVNQSHFVRCAIMQLIRKHEKGEPLR